MTNLSKYFLNEERTEPFYLNEGEEIINVKDNGDGSAILLVRDTKRGGSGPFDVFYAPRVRYYVEYRNGNCSVIEASSEEIAREEAADFVRAWRSPVSRFRVATQDDLDNFGGQIYQVS